VSSIRALALDPVQLEEDIVDGGGRRPTAAAEDAANSIGRIAGSGLACHAITLPCVDDESNSGNPFRRL